MDSKIKRGLVNPVRNGGYIPHTGAQHLQPDVRLLVLRPILGSAFIDTVFVFR